MRDNLVGPEVTVLGLTSDTRLPLILTIAIQVSQNKIPHIGVLCFKDGEPWKPGG